MKDTIEVEQKYRVESHEPYVAKLPADLPSEAFGVQTLEVDIYYQHPVKDYTKTDEWLRIRNWQEIIYKGPKLTANTRVRPEYKWEPEWPELLLETLGFTKLIEIHKGRTTGKWACNYENHDYFVTIALDNVKNLGSFIEIEIVTERKDMAFAVERIEEIAKIMGLENQEFKGYAEMLLELPQP